MQAQTYDRGASGDAQYQPNSYFVGGYGTALKQIFRRDFPNEAGSLGLSIPLRNRQAQGDYGIDQLQFRQSQVGTQRDTNQIVVDVSNQSAHCGSPAPNTLAAKQTRALKRSYWPMSARSSLMGYPRSTTSSSISAHWLAAQISEVNAVATYARARVSLDQVLGETLEKNNISLNEGLTGQVPR